MFRHNGSCTAVVMDEKGELIASSSEDGSVKARVRQSLTFESFNFIMRFNNLVRTIIYL